MISTMAGKLSYTASLFHQIDNSVAQTYLREPSGTPVYTGNVNSNGYNYNIAASTFANNLYDWEQTHLAQGLSLKSGTDGDLQWEIVGSDYAYLADNEHIPATALPGALSTAVPGAGTNTSMNGTGWYTLDAKGVWRGWTGNEVSFGLHRDQETLSQIKNNTSDWMSVAPASIATDAKGRTATNAIWVQDIWSILPDLKATLGCGASNGAPMTAIIISASPVLECQSSPRFTPATFRPRHRWPGSRRTLDTDGLLWRSLPHADGDRALPGDHHRHAA